MGVAGAIGDHPHARALGLRRPATQAAGLRRR
jgi:hypothetical protein